MKFKRDVSSCTLTFFLPHPILLKYLNYFLKAASMATMIVLGLHVAVDVAKG